VLSDVAQKLDDDVVEEVRRRWSRTSREKQTDDLLGRGLPRASSAYAREGDGSLLLAGFPGRTATHDLLDADGVRKASRTRACSVHEPKSLGAIFARECRCGGDCEYLCNLDVVEREGAALPCLLEPA
jgi:hypothetical protein